MANRSIQRLLGQFQRLLDTGFGDAESDASLLHRYLHEQDDRAFSLLVRRHGSMVMGVCRGVLHHEQDAEDAFQATFAMLARKARLVQWRQSISGWLHHAAYQASVDILRATQGRRNHEAEAARQRSDAMRTKDPMTELQELVNEALVHLPEKYRTPFVLCHLEGKTISEAMRELGCKERTVYHRLTIAKQLLQRHLVKRGIALSTVLTLLVLRRPAQAFVESRLVEVVLTTARSVTPSGGSCAVGRIPVAAMSLGRIWWVVCLGVGLTVIAGGSWVVRWSSSNMGYPAVVAQAEASKFVADAKITDNPAERTVCQSDRPS